MLVLHRMALLELPTVTYQKKKKKSLQRILARKESGLPTNQEKKGSMIFSSITEGLRVNNIYPNYRSRQRRKNNVIKK